MKTKTNRKQNEIKVLELGLESLGSDIDLNTLFNNPRQQRQKLDAHCVAYNFYPQVYGSHK